MTYNVMFSNNLAGIWQSLPQLHFYAHYSTHKCGGLKYKKKSIDDYLPNVSSVNTTTTPKAVANMPIIHFLGNSFYIQNIRRILF